MAIKSQKPELLTQPLRTKSSGHNLSLSALALGVLGIACSFTSAHALDIGKSTVNSIKMSRYLPLLTCRTLMPIISPQNLPAHLPMPICS